MARIDSIIQKDPSFCFLCGSYANLETHHIFGGNPNRRISEENGFKVRLCHWCHNEPPNGVHHNRSRDLTLKRLCQKKYEKNHTRDEFIRLIGKNYIQEET